MNWIHKHSYKLVGKTYAEPFKGEMTGATNTDSFQKMMSGATTFLWKCQDDTCSKIVKQECLGKETSTCDCTCGCESCTCCKAK
jgi:hypothetical protein